jgi:hypothetical protein
MSATDSRKLGKKAARHDSKALLLASYLTSMPIAPLAPASFSHGSTTWDYPMMLNDSLGDCTIACAGHLVQLWTGLNGSQQVIPDADIESAYIAVTKSEGAAYNPKTKANDNGCVIADVLKYWQNTGIGGHKIAGSVSLEPGNADMVRGSVYLFGGIDIGVQLPISAQGQAIWSVPPGGAVGNGAPGSWGGHSVPVVGYGPNYLTVITWGALLHMTWGFFAAYCDEAYVPLSADWMNAKENSPDGIAWDTLQADLAKL